MSSRAKRLLLLLLLLILIFVFCYFIATCSGLRDPGMVREELEGEYLTQDATVRMEIRGDEMEIRTETEKIDCEILSFESGVLRVQTEDGTEYQFAVQSGSRIYSGNLNKYFYRVM